MKQKLSNRIYSQNIINISRKSGDWFFQNNIRVTAAKENLKLLNLEEEKIYYLAFLLESGFSFEDSITKTNMLNQSEILELKNCFNLK